MAHHPNNNRNTAMSDEFYRLSLLPPYVIAEINAMRAAARRKGEDVIDLGMGNPDLPPPQHVIDKLIEVASKPDAHGYSQSKGIPGLRRAQANYYGTRFNVELDPETEVVVTMGSKEGLASLATAITAPGDVVLAPDPSYPIHTFGFIMAGATIHAVPTTPDEFYFQSLEKAVADCRPKPKVLVVNYPSNPTAETVDLAFYERLVAFAKDNNLYVISDLAYSELYYDGKPTRSILEVPGGKDVAVVGVGLLGPPADGGKQRFRCVTGDLRHQLGQLRRIGGHVDRPVELVVQPYCAFPVVGGVSTLQLVLDLLELAQLGFGDTDRRPGRQFRAEVGLHVRHVGDIAMRHRAHHETAAGLLLEQPLCLQLEQRLAHRGDADTQFGGELVQTHIRAGGVGPVEDPPPDKTCDILGELRTRGEIGDAHPVTPGSPRAAAC